MKSRIFFTVFKLFPVVYFILNIGTLSAQDVRVNLQIPPPNKFRVEDLWKLTLFNTTQNRFTVHLEGSVTESQAGLIVTGVSKSFDLPAGRKIFTAANYMELDPEINFVNKDPRFEESIIRGGGFPSGEYEICVSVINDLNRDELGSQCIEQQVILAGPPSLISPEDGTELKIKNPVFMWTPVAGIPGVQYLFRIVEVYGNQSVQEAIENNDAFYSTTIRQPLLTYPAQARQFEEGKQYAWRVQSVDQNGNPVGSDNGLSEVWSFIFTLKGGITEYKITRQEAIDIIIKKIIVPPTLDHDVSAFLGMTPTDSGTTYYPYSHDEMEKTIQNPVWFGWINDAPQAFFSHDTRYVFIDVRTGSYTIETYYWWPVVNGESLWMSEEEKEKPDVLIYSTVHFK